MMMCKYGGDGDGMMWGFASMRVSLGKRFNRNN